MLGIVLRARWGQMHMCSGWEWQVIDRKIFTKTFDYEVLVEKKIYELEHRPIQQQVRSQHMACMYLTTATWSSFYTALLFDHTTDVFDACVILFKLILPAPCTCYSHVFDRNVTSEHALHYAKECKHLSLSYGARSLWWRRGAWELGLWP